MDIGAVIVATAVTSAMVALAAAVFIGIRWVRKVLGPMVADGRLDSSRAALVPLAQQCRTEQFLESEDFVLRHLRHAHGPEGGVYGLQAAAREHVVRVAAYFSGLGMTLATGAGDQAVVVGAVGHRVRLSWAILEPYIVRERQLHQSSYMAYFEHLATLAVSDVPSGRIEVGLFADGRVVKDPGQHDERAAEDE